MRNTRVSRSIITFIIPAFMLAAVVAVPLVFADRLPDPVASHWGISGEPDGYMPLWLLVTIAGGIVLFAWLALVLADRRGTASSSMVAVVYFIGSLIVALQVLTVWANLDAPSWDAAKNVGLAHVAGVVAVAVLAGAIGWFLSGRDGVVFEGETGTEVPTVHLGSDEYAVWASKSESNWMPFLAVAFLVAAAMAGGIAGLILLGISVIVLMFSAARVIANDRGVSVGFGWWGWPRRWIELDDISRVEVLDVEPMSFGGWGLRVVGGRAATGTWAVVIRRGPGIRIVRADAADIAVTVDDARRGAGLVNDLLRRRGTLVPDNTMDS